MLSSSILPLAIAGVAAGAAVTLLRLRGARAGAALLGVAVAVGLLATAVTDSWLGALTGDWWSEAGAIALTVLAIGAPVAGLAALIGTPGIGLGALLMVLLGNSFSGVTSAPELLPGPSARSASCCRRGRAGRCCGRSPSSTAPRRAARP